MTASRCSSSHSHTQKMPDCIMSQGQGAPGKNGGPGSNHQHRPAHRLGIIDYLCTKGKQWALLMSRSVWPQQSNLLQSSQDAAVVEVAHEFVNSRYFTKPDAHHGYWSIVLDEESSLLTTFNSPFGRYCFLHLPFGLVCSQDIFQKKMDQYPQRVPWMYQNHQWHHPTWLYWGRTWCLSAEPHTGSQQVWSCVQSTENACKGPRHKLLWLPIRCQWCPPGPREGWCCTCSPSTHKCHWTPRVPPHGDIPQPLHPWPVHSDCSSVRTPEKRCQLHLEWQLRGHFSVGQASCHQQDNPQVLWPITACDHTNQCLTGRSWCSTSTR